MPTFKPVGIDENSLFPDRVETRLSTTIDGKLVADRARELAAIGASSRVPMNTVVVFGTSLEALNDGKLSDLDPGTDGISGRGWFHWCNAYLGNELTAVKMAGVGGNTTAQMLARVDADVLAYASDWVFIGGPTNDTSTGHAASETIANITAILDKLAGRRVLIQTGPPNSGHETLGEKSALFEVNTWIRNLPNTRPNVVVADAWRALSNGTVTPVVGLTVDTVHYTAMAAARVGKVSADAVRRLISSTSHRTTSPDDPACIIANPQLTSGTGWSTLGTGVSSAFAPDDDTPTTKAVLTYSGVTSSGNLGIQCAEPLAGGRWAVGEIVQVTARIRWSSAVALNVVCNLGPLLMLAFRCEDNSAFEYKWGEVAGSFARVPVQHPTSGDVVISTARMTIPATNAGSPVVAVEIRAGFRGIASGVVSVSDLSATRVA